MVYGQCRRNPRRIERAIALSYYKMCGISEIKAK